jgi:hypothetical protein
MGAGPHCQRRTLWRRKRFRSGIRATTTGPE